MEKKEISSKKLAVTVLSLSLLTVMAGAAVAPALGVIERYFAGESQLLIQMIISVPAIFIVFTNMFFPKMCKVCKSRTLVLIGLILYTVGGCAAGLFSSIYTVLAARALVGIGVGIVMPMSTGLLAFYFPPDRQATYMGYSSAMNQMGGVIATLLSGLLAGISWRASFLVYLMGLISIILCLIFLPNHRIVSEETHASGGAFKEYYAFVIAIFLLMTTFFIYPANFAMETVAEGVIPQKFISVIMAGMDFVAFVGGLSFVLIMKRLLNKTRLLAPGLFLLGYVLLLFPGGWIGTLAGSVCIGFANGLGIPFIISTASRKAGKTAATTVMPLISMALYLAQFLTPVIMSVVKSALSGHNIAHLPYMVAVVVAVLLLIWSVVELKEKK
ncbi:MFS transporter [Aminicella lysinilytica]|uniref:MFS transporter n=1 Tax=Aminicella lysinilytica TaxID=433323 RepID=UPI0026F27147|nr:MFS transporter [Aminicella lysinilytica]